jgi:uncharacterized membrane protein YecN with MAPEG domain
MLVTHLQVVALYAGLNALILLGLSLLVVRARRAHKVLIGDGGNPALVRAQRAHGNAAEYIPLVLILMLALAGLKASTLLLHAIGIALTFGRLLHGIGLNQSAGVSVGRALGMVLTWAALIVAAASCLYYALAV